MLLAILLTAGVFLAVNVSNGYSWKSYLRRSDTRILKGTLSISASRLPEWDPGVSGGIPLVANQVNVMDYGALADNSTDDVHAFNAAIQAVTPPGAVFVPAGTYYIASPIILKSGVVIRGEGPKKTKLWSNILGTDWIGTGAIHIEGSKGGTFAVEGSIPVGASTFRLASYPYIENGTFLYLILRQ